MSSKDVNIEDDTTTQPAQDDPTSGENPPSSWWKDFRAFIYLVVVMFYFYFYLYIYVCVCVCVCVYDPLFWIIWIYLITFISSLLLDESWYNCLLRLNLRVFGW